MYVCSKLTLSCRITHDLCFFVNIRESLIYYFTIVFMYLCEQMRILLFLMNNLFIDYRVTCSHSWEFSFQFKNSAVNAISFNAFNKWKNELIYVLISILFETVAFWKKKSYCSLEITPNISSVLSTSAHTLYIRDIV